MQDDRTDLVKHLWQIVYDYLRGPGSTKNHSSHMMLAPRFDEDLLNDISALTRPIEGKDERVASIRAKVEIAQAVGLFGHNDVEQINLLLDKVGGNS